MPDIETHDRITPAEASVLFLISESYTNKAIAKELFMAIKTVEGHVNQIISKVEIPEGRNKRVWLAIHAHELREKRYLSNKVEV